MWRAGRGGAEVHRRAAYRVRRVRRQAQEGVLRGGDRLQGFGLLPYGLKERLGCGGQGQAVGRFFRQDALDRIGLLQRQWFARQWFERQRFGGQAGRQEVRVGVAPGQVVILEREGRLTGHGRPGDVVVPFGQHRRCRRFRVLRVPRRRRAGQDRHPVRGAERPGYGGRGVRPPGRLPAPARP